VHQERCDDARRSGLRQRLSHAHKCGGYFSAQPGYISATNGTETDVPNIIVTLPAMYVEVYDMSKKQVVYLHKIKVHLMSPVRVGLTFCNRLQSVI